MPAPLPPTVGKYQVIDRLAVGGMAELLKARATGQHGFEKLVALKKILPHLANDASFVEMFYDEARLTAQLDHPNIVQVFELGTDADTPYIAMQFVDGLDVLGLLRECARAQIRLPAELAAFIARQVLDALDYAHTVNDTAGRALGIIHRDISPGNILLSWRGDVKLTDFGIARAIERQHKTEAGTLKGKYGYMAPEQVSGGEMDARCDVFAVGVVLAEMVMARRLFTAPNDLDVLLMVRDARLDRLQKYAAEFPVDLRGLIVRALARNPDDRWRSAAEFRDILDDWLARKGRITGRDLAEFVGRVVDAPTVDPEGVVAHAYDDLGTLSGPSTRMSHAEAAAHAKAARASFIAGDGSATVEQELAGDSSAAITIEDGDLVAERGSQLSTPSEAGELATEPLIALLYRIARSRSTGLLTLHGADAHDGAIKEAFIAEGHPQYVNSNLPDERLGPFLVAEGALSKDALARAVAVMGHFGNRLADTLVGIGVLTPLDAYRLLAKQIGNKLITACAWPRGRFVWRIGRQNPWQVRPLHLDAFRIVGAGATLLDAETVTAWAQGHTDRLVIGGTDTSMLPAFGLGEAPVRVHAMLDGRATLGELATRPRSPESRLNLARLIYLLVHTKLATLG
jgi:eukaryotic-like serine/threonine-protein kinase